MAWCQQPATSTILQTTERESGRNRRPFQSNYGECWCFNNNATSFISHPMIRVLTRKNKAVNWALQSGGCQYRILIYAQMYQKRSITNCNIFTLHVPDQEVDGYSFNQSVVPILNTMLITRTLPFTKRSSNCPLPFSFSNNFFFGYMLSSPMPLTYSPIAFFFLFDHADNTVYGAENT